MKLETKATSEWFKELPPNLSRVATQNAIPMRLLDKYSSLRGALAGAFVWSKSEEGFDFWFGISKALQYDEPLDKWESELEIDELGPGNVALAKQMLAEMEEEDGN